MARIGRFQLVVGLALGASLVFLGFLLARPVGDGSVQLTANLAQLVAPSLAAASCAWAAASGSGWNRRAWAPAGRVGRLGLAVADTGFAYLTQEGAYRTGAPPDVGWFAGYLLVAAAAWRPAAVGITWVGRRPGRYQVLLPYVPLAWP
jgi:hypothetical protein